MYRILLNVWFERIQWTNSTKSQSDFFILTIKYTTEVKRKKDWFGLTVSEVSAHDQPGLFYEVVNEGGDIYKTIVCINTFYVFFWIITCWEGFTLNEKINSHNL